MISQNESVGSRASRLMRTTLAPLQVRDFRLLFSGQLLVGGLLSDRLRPRRVMLLADLGRTLLVSALVALAAAGQTAVWPLSLVSAPLGACTGLFIPASYTILPEVLDEDELPAGNALNSSTYQLAVLVGSAIAGVVVPLPRISPSGSCSVSGGCCMLVWWSWSV